MSTAPITAGNSLPKNILIFFSGKPYLNKSRILKFYRGALRSTIRDFDFLIVSYNENATESLTTIQLDGIDFKQKIYGRTLPEKLGYPNKGNGAIFRLKPGNCDMPILALWKEFTHYERYWVVEDDVDYSGDCSLLFDDIGTRTEALVATHVYPSFPAWDYYSIFKSGQSIIRDENKWLCFLPFFVVKFEALKYIDNAYSRGWAGHHEMTWPTILLHASKPIFDIGGCGPLVPHDYKNKFYIGSPNDHFNKTGSFGTKEIRLAHGKEMNKLWHPVKSFPEWVSQMRKRVKSYLNWRILNSLNIIRRLDKS